MDKVYLLLQREANKLSGNYLLKRSWPGSLTAVNLNEEEIYNLSWVSKAKIMKLRM